MSQTSTHAENSDKINMPTDSYKLGMLITSLITTMQKDRAVLMQKVKAYHTRYRALGPELIPVYRQSARSHAPGSRLPLLSARPTVISAAERHRALDGTKLCCLVTEAHRCEQLAKVVMQLCRFELMTCWSQVQGSTHCATIDIRQKHIQQQVATFICY